MPFSYRKVGVIRFIKVGRCTVTFCRARARRVAAVAAPDRLVTALTLGARYGSPVAFALLVAGIVIR